MAHDKISTWTLYSSGILHQKTITQPKPQQTIFDALFFKMWFNFENSKLTGLIEVISLSIPIRCLVLCHNTPTYVFGKQVVRYISGTMEKKGFYAQFSIKPSPVTAHDNADWAVFNDSPSLKTGTNTTIIEASVSFSSKLQTITTVISLYAQYNVFFQFWKVVLHLRRLSKNSLSALQSMKSNFSKQFYTPEIPQPFH